LLNKCSNEVITCCIIDITNFSIKSHWPCIIHNTKLWVNMWHHHV
jgi:hypothetical protein